MVSVFCFAGDEVVKRIAECFVKFKQRAGSSTGINMKETDCNTLR